jgi:hypothetical protein
MGLPRPILKLPSQFHPDPTDDKSLSLPSKQYRNTVHFPPSPILSRTFSAHSSSAYDRSPIVVLPNICALPARGCPGRTYIPGCTAPSSSHISSNLHAQEVALKAGGKHMHPRRALGLALVPESTSEQATSTSTIPPPLVPDLSSESDESDGFASPPSELGANTAVTNPLAILPFASLPNLNLGDGLLHSPQSPDEEEYQYHSYDEGRRRRRKRDRGRGKGGRDQFRRQWTPGCGMSTPNFERKFPDGIPEEDEDEEAEDDGTGECRYKSFFAGTTLRGCGLEADEETCLGGF